MKPIFSILFLFISLHSFSKKRPPVLFLDNYWKHFEFYENKIKKEKFQSVFFPHLPDVVIYGSELSLLQRKLLYHEIGVPVFTKPSSVEEDTDASQYLKWIIFSKQDPKKIFPDIIRRPLGYVPNFITESFYRFGISVPL